MPLQFLQFKIENMLKKVLLRGIAKYTNNLLLEQNTFKKATSEKVGADKGKLIPTDIGMIVNDFLVDNFKNILDFNFTAEVEQSLMILQKEVKIGLKCLKLFTISFIYS